MILTLWSIGKYTDNNNLTAVSQCDDCPETRACYIGTGGTQKLPADCATGHYCPKVSVEHFINYHSLYCNLQQQSHKLHIFIKFLVWTCQGTAAPMQYPCPPGTFTVRNNLKAASECTNCTRGYYCLEGTSNPHKFCFKGHYCPEGQYNLPLILHYFVSKVQQNGGVFSAFTCRQRL